MVRVVKRRRWKPWVYSIAVVLLLSGGYTYWSLQRPLPIIRPTIATGSILTPTATTQLQWPSEQSAAATIDSSDIKTSGTQTPLPTASTAKIITSLMVLRKKPLQTGQPGPIITLGLSDVALYKAYAAADGSLVPVTNGEQLSEYQMLEAIMLPSANNIADSLAIWAYGSLDNYAIAANAYLQSIGLRGTHVGKDASGLDPTTTSTASDLVRLGQLAMKHPVLSQIVSQPNVTNFPVAGTIRNVNMLLGTNGVVGVKTGNSDQAGGVYVAAATTPVNGKNTIVITALMGAPTLGASINDSLPLINSARANFKPVSIIDNTKKVGDYRVPWAGSISAVASDRLQLDAWSGVPVATKIKLTPISSSEKRGSTVGTIEARVPAAGGKNRVHIVLQQDVPQPRWWWRMLHPLN